MALYQLQGNEYRLTPFKVRKTNLCDLVNNENIVVPNLYKGFGLEKHCPVLKGNYTGEWTFDYSKVPPNFDGNYKIAVSFFKGSYNETYVSLVEVHHFVV